MPERDVRTELGHEFRQVDRREGRHLARQCWIEPLHLGRRQVGALGDLTHRNRPRRAHRENALLRDLSPKPSHVDGVAEHHLRVAKRAHAVGAIEVAIASQRDPAQVLGELRSHHVLLARGGAAQALAVDECTPHVERHPNGARTAPE